MLSEKIEEYFIPFLQRNVQFVCDKKVIKKGKLSGKNFYYLSKNNNLKEAAKNLYKTLRMIKKKKFKSIAIEKIPNIGFGEAINDRLPKASKF